jgi:hypothetical protein
MRDSFHRSLAVCILFLSGSVPTWAGQAGDETQSKASEATGASRNEELATQSRALGTPYVELDSWIYPAIERLAALNYIHTQFLGMRPWTRLDCAFAVREAGDAIEASGSSLAEAVRLHDAL